MDPKTPRLQESFNKTVYSLPLLRSENPVISPRNSSNYVAYYKNLRMSNLTPDNFVHPKTAGETSLSAVEVNDIETKLKLVLAKSKGFETISSVMVCLKSLVKSLSYQSVDVGGCFKAVKSIVNSIGVIIDDFSKQKAQISKLSEELEQVKSERKQLQISNISLAGQISSLEKSANRLKTAKKTQNIEANSRKYALEKERLIEKVESLENYIAELKDVTKIDIISAELDLYKEKYEKMCKEYKLSIKEKEATIYKLEIDIGLLKDKIASKETYANSFHLIEKELKDRIKIIQDKYYVLSQEHTESKERLLMFREDISRFIKYRDLYETTFEQLNTIKNKYQHLEINLIANNISLGPEKAIWIDLNDPIFAITRRTSMTEHHTNFALRENSALNKLDYASISQRGKGKSNMDMNFDLTQINLKDFTLTRPMFAGFLEINDTSLPLELPFSNWLELTIRGIYDSKHFEHQLCSFESGRFPARFPEFVYSWLGSFTIDQASRQVKDLENWKKPSADRIRIDLLLALSQEKYKKNWEIQTFVEFVNENMMVDELAFFLHCRNLLFKGPQLSTTSGMLTSVHFLPINRVYEVIDIIMEKIQDSERAELKDMLKSKSKEKDGIFNLDTGLVLRVFLEYYIREKKSKYMIIRSLVNMAPKRKKGQNLTFRSFAEIIRNLNSEVTDNTVSALYRDCFALSNGNISADHIFIIFNESCFFFYNLRLNSDLGSTDDLKSIYSVFNKYKVRLNLIKTCIKNIGISDLLFNFQRLENYIINKEMGEGVISIKNSFKHLWVLVAQVKNVFFNVNYINLSSFISGKIVEAELASGPDSCSDFIELLQIVALNKINFKAAVRKIQRNWKKKYNKIIMIGKSVGAFKRLLNKSKNKNK